MKTSQTLHQRLWLTLVVASLLPCLAPMSKACSVPVFRYGLLWWGTHQPEDCYRVILYHRGPLTDAQLAMLKPLQQRAWQVENEKDPGANYLVHTFDLDDNLPDTAKELWQQQKSPTEPWMVLRYPPASQIGLTAWAGPLNDQSIKLIMQSPARQDLAKRLMGGQTAVWLLLESGDKQKDDAAAQTLQNTLQKMEKLLRLPTEEDDTIDTTEDRALEEAATHDSLPPLQIKFSLIRLAADNADEQMLWRMLRSSEADLETDYASEPMAFPVFGRGRSLLALVGGGLNEQLISEYCGYLVGMCSCQIKAANPGFDLLIDAPWNSLLDSMEPAGDTYIADLPSTITSEPSTADPAISGNSVALANSDAHGADTDNAVPAETDSPDIVSTVTESAPPRSSDKKLIMGIGIAVGVVVAAMIGLVIWTQRRYEQN